jgi:hypothetical protein
VSGRSEDSVASEYTFGEEVRISRDVFEGHDEELPELPFRAQRENKHVYKQDNG